MSRQPKKRIKRHAHSDFIYDMRWDGFVCGRCGWFLPWDIDEDRA